MIVNVVLSPDLFVFQVEIEFGALQGPLSELRVHDNQGVVLKFASQAISNIWREHPPEMHVHVIVKLPAGEEVLESLSHSFVKSAFNFPSAWYWQFIQSSSSPRSRP
jgi:hypothetical protein